MKNIFLIEDHDEALRVWRKAGIRGLDLVHVDAHIDLDIPAAKSVEEILDDATSARDVKKGLEDLVAFQWYEKRLGEQTHIGNYIYPALREGIVRNFFWVIPGTRRTFGRQVFSVRQILRSVVGPGPRIIIDRTQAVIRTLYLGREIFVCCLESLPVLPRPVLLDVDADFFVTPGIPESDPVKYAGRHAMWLTPAEAVQALKEKKLQPAFVTIAYSVRGGFTPSRFRYLADAFAAGWDKRRFEKRYHRHEKAAAALAAFETFHLKSSYRKAVRLDPGLRHADNHDGFLFLSRGRVKKAGKEFRRILRVDPGHVACWVGLGNVALARRNKAGALRASRHFSKALVLCRSQKKFHKLESAIFVGLGRSWAKLGRDLKAAASYEKARSLDPLNPEVYYSLGVLSQKRKCHEKAASLFQDAIRLGFPVQKPLDHLKKICCFLLLKKDIIKYISVMSRRLKRNSRRFHESSRRFQKKQEDRLAGHR